MFQVTEDPSKYKPFSNQPSFFAPDPDTVPNQKVPPTTDSNSIPSNGKVPLDVALQQHLDKQHEMSAAEQANSLTPQELYTLLNGNPAATMVPQTAYMVPQQVMYAVPQQLQYAAAVQPAVQGAVQLQQQPYAAQPSAVQLQYAVQPQAAVQLQYAQPQPVELQYLQQQPQGVQLQYAQQQQPEQYAAAQAEFEQQQYQLQQQQQQQQLQQQQLQQQQQQEPDNEVQYQQQPENQVQYQQQQQQEDEQGQDEEAADDYEPRNPQKGSTAAETESATAQDQQKFASIKDQYYSAVPNEQTAGVLAQIAESAANNDAEERPSKPHQQQQQLKSGSGGPSAPSGSDSVQIQQSVPLYEGTYSSRRSNQEYVDDELMEGSETSASVAAAADSAVNGHAPNQFPYNAAKINAIAVSA